MRCLILPWSNQQFLWGRRNRDSLTGQLKVHTWTLSNTYGTRLRQALTVKLATTRGGEGRGGEVRVERPIIKKVGRYRPGKKGISFRSGDCVPRLTAMVDTFGTECFDGSDLRGSGRCWDIEDDERMFVRRFVWRKSIINTNNLSWYLSSHLCMQLTMLTVKPSE